MPIRPFILPKDLDTMNSLVMDGFEYPENPAWSVQEDEKEGMMGRINGVKRMWPYSFAPKLIVPDRLRV
jgi:hypothetical protein